MLRYYWILFQWMETLSLYGIYHFISIFKGKKRGKAKKKRKQPSRPPSPVYVEVQVYSYFSDFGRYLLAILNVPYISCHLCICTLFRLHRFECATICNDLRIIVLTTFLKQLIDLNKFFSFHCIFISFINKSCFFFFSENYSVLC